MTSKPRTLLLLALGLAFGATALVAQGPPFGQPSQPAVPPINQSDDPLLKTFVWRSIGPASMGGRIDDIVGVESSPSTFYVGFATGGVWKTVNNGTTFTPIFDTYPVSSIGDIAIAPSNPEIVWVGTGEPNNRQSSSFGDGIYKSTDGGKIFTHMGLKDTQSIARVVIDPKDPNTVYVAALGHLFGPNEERGIFRSTDGGETFQKVLYRDENTGAADIALDPANPDIVYAVLWEARQGPWENAAFSGPGSGLFKSTDGGDTWTEITRNPGGPKGENITLNMPGNVTFAVNSADISASFYPVLDSVGLVLNEFNQTMVEVAGHTDSDGSDAYNQQLSERRASSVVAYLVSRQVRGDRLLTVGAGETRPVASNATPEGKQQNRRVEITIVPLTN